MLSKKKRFEVLKRDNFRCQYCGKTGKDVTLEVDHIKPRSKWGTDDMENLITCCRECNMGKGNEEINSRDSTFSIKLKDLSERVIKQFFKERNEMYKKTIDRKTVGLIATYVKRKVDHNLDFIAPEIARKYKDKDEWFRNEKIIDFNRWWETFDEFSLEYEEEISNECFLDREYYIEDNSEFTRNIKDYSCRLNYIISSKINNEDIPPRRIIKKYSLYPNAKIPC